MDTMEAILTRRTSHIWKDLPVPETVVSDALAAAHMAPCHKLTWPWRFVRVAPAERIQLFELAVRLKCGDSTPTEGRLEMMRKKVLYPAHLIVVTQVRSDDPVQAREDYGAIASAIQNVALTVHAAGYASKWGSGGLTQHPETYALLGVDERSEEIVGFVWVGVPAHENPPAPKRPPLESFVRWSS